MRHHILSSIALTLVFSFVLTSRTAIAAPDNEGNAKTESSFFQVSIYPPVQLVDEQKNITGFRLNLGYAKNADVSGIDLGLGVNSYKNFMGIQIGGIANAVSANYSATVKGVQIAGLTNNLDDDAAVKGMQIAGFGNHASYLSGIQIAIFGNLVRQDATGIQFGLINMVGGSKGGELNGIQIGALNNFAWNAGVSEGDVSGIQIGIVNYAHNVTGLQIGLINGCSDLKGVQIGLINYIEKGRFPFLPIINAKF